MSDNIVTLKLTFLDAASAKEFISKAEEIGYYAEDIVVMRDRHLTMNIYKEDEAALKAFAVEKGGYTPTKPDFH